MSGVDAKALGRALLSGQGHGQAVRSVAEARHADLIDAANLEAASIVERARAEAGAIVTAARADADRQREQARHDAEDAAREVAHGLRASMDRDRERVDRAVRAVSAACEVLLDDLRHARVEIAHATQPSNRSVTAAGIVQEPTVHPVAGAAPKPVIADDAASAPTNSSDLAGRLAAVPRIDLVQTLEPEPIAHHESSIEAATATIEQPVISLVEERTIQVEGWTPTPTPPPPPLPRLPRLPTTPPEPRRRRRRA